MRFANHIALVVGAAGSSGPSDPCKALANMVGGFSTESMRAVICNSLQRCDGIVRRSHTTPIEVISYDMIKHGDVLFPITCTDASIRMTPGFYLKHSRSDEFDEQDEEDTLVEEAIMPPPPLVPLNAGTISGPAPRAVVRSGADEEDTLVEGAIMLPPPLVPMNARTTSGRVPRAVIRIGDIVTEGGIIVPIHDGMSLPRLVSTFAVTTDAFSVLRSRIWTRATVRDSSLVDSDFEDCRQRNKRRAKDAAAEAELCDVLQGATLEEETPVRILTKYIKRMRRDRSDGDEDSDDCSAAGSLCYRSSPHQTVDSDEMMTEPTVSLTPVQIAREQLEILFEAIESHITPLVLQCPSVTMEQVEAIESRFQLCDSALTQASMPFHSGSWLPRYIASNHRLMAVIRALETAVETQSGVVSPNNGGRGCSILLWRATMLIVRLKDIAQKDQSEPF